MQVIVPYHLGPGRGAPWAFQAVQLALRQDGWEARYEEMKGDEDYYNLMREMWREAVTF